MRWHRGHRCRSGSVRLTARSADTSALALPTDAEHSGRMGMTIEDASVFAERQGRAPVRRTGGVAVVALVLAVSVFGFVIGRATSPKPSFDQWHLGKAVVMSSGQVAVVAPSGIAPIVPRDVAWVDRSGGIAPPGHPGVPCNAWNGGPSMATGDRLARWLDSSTRGRVDRLSSIAAHICLMERARPRRGVNRSACSSHGCLSHNDDRQWSP